MGRRNSFAREKRAERTAAGRVSRLAVSDANVKVAI
jgi:hypothetical protein